MSVNISVYAGGVLAYDSRLPAEKGYTMQSIYLRERVNTGGSATLVLPPLHPVREGFPAFTTLVEIYRDGALRWRGRPLPESRDFYCRGSITCEGELCFLQDAVLRPGTYSGDLADVFAAYVAAYNGRVEAWKQFAVGVITVTAPEALSIVKKSAEKVYKAIMELVATYGGYIIFDSAPDGSRRINWYAEMPYSCNQRIMLGYNLTDYSSSVNVSGFATRIIPYGADDENGNPITIDVDGKDYVENADAVAQRGIIEATVTYPDILDPAELLEAAQRDVDKAASLPEIIKLSALDMSRQDLSKEAFRMGQRIYAESAPHKLSGYYDLLSLEEDLVNPGVGGISLVREGAYVDTGSSVTLTGAVVGNQAYADNAAKQAVSAQTQIDIFNKLTNNGAAEGIFLKDGQLYVNVKYLAAGILASADGKIQIDLGSDSNIPVFNTGISTNGLIVRGDAANAQSLFTATALKGAYGDYYYGDVNFFSADGPAILHITEAFNADYSEKVGVTMALYNKSRNKALEFSVVEDIAGIWLRNNGVNSGFLGQMSDGASALIINQVNSKTVSWKDNGDGTYTLVGS